MIIYAPLISDIIPAFVYNSQVTLKVPFSMNPAVSKAEVSKISLTIKDYISSQVLKKDILSTSWSAETGEAIFSIPQFYYNLSGIFDVFPQKSQYYKIQIAYCDNENNIGELSSAAMVRCVSSPIDLYITDYNEQSLEKGQTENFVKYKGVYLREENSEPLYSYKFDLYNQYKELMETSEEQIWDSRKDKLLNKTEESFIPIVLSDFDQDTRMSASLCFNLDEDAGNPFENYDEYRWESIHLPSLTKQEAQENYQYKINLTLNNSGYLRYIWSASTSSYSGIYLEAGKYELTFTITITFSGPPEYDYVDYTVISPTINKPTLSNIVKSTPEFHILNELEYGKTYNLDFTITTVNGYKETVTRSIIKATNLTPSYNLQLSAAADQNDGFIKVWFEPEEATGINGQFILERNSLKEPNIWQELTTFSIGTSNDLSKWSWKDFSVAHNDTYIYRIRQFNNGKFSYGINSQPIKVKFEDIFLTDENRQLKIKFNPKVSSFKTTLQESKTEAIGNKYPYFFKNAQIGYKEIPISGLLSYLIDDNQFFITDEELELGNEIDNIRTTNLIDYNIAAERTFKLKVLDWLNNGKPKLFRSAEEGNYIVRLMNVSLSPNDTVGRMLHTFSATGYEIADNSLENLNSLKIMKLDEISNEIKSKIWQGAFNEFDNSNFVIRDINKQCYYVDYIQNLKWTTLILENQENCFIRLYKTAKDYDNNIYMDIRNFTGIVETPKDTYYHRVEIYGNMNNSYFYFDQLSNDYLENEDTFGKGTYITKWETISSTKTFSPSVTVHYLALSKSGDGDSTIILNNNSEIIDLSDGQTRYYYDLNLNSITINNALAIIYYTEEAV